MLRPGADLTIPLLLAGALMVAASLWGLGDQPRAASERVAGTAVLSGRAAVLEDVDALTEEHVSVIEEVDRHHQRQRGLEQASLMLSMVQPGEEGSKAWRNEREMEAEDRILMRRAAFSNLMGSSSRERMGAALDTYAQGIETEVANSVHPLVVRSVVIVAATVLLLVGVAGWNWRRRVTLPLERLAGTMDAVAAGSLEAEVQAAGPALCGADESLQRMVRTLVAARQEMDAKVDRQTAALAAALDELREAQARLVRQERMAALGSLAGGVAHEFNNLLGGIRGCADDALEDARDESVAESLTIIRRTAERGRKIVDGLLRFSQAVAREPRPIDLAGVVSEIVVLATHAAESRGVALEVNFAMPLEVRADPTEIHQVIHNLVLNAIQASAAGQVVSIEGESRDDVTVLRVLDRGSGITPEIAGRIYEPFFTTRETEGGVGLGLAMSHGITQALGGKLQYTDREGGGTVFHLELPREGEADEQD